MNQNLVIPVALWQAPPIHHAITCILVSPDSTKLVTGSKNGNIYLWDLDLKNLENPTQILPAAPVKPGSPLGTSPLKNAPKSPRKIDLSQEVIEKETKSEEEKPASIPKGVELKFVLIGHKAAIVSLLSCVFDSKDAIVSVSTDGTVCLWKFQDGECLLSSEKLLKCSPTTVTMLPSGYHLACSGNRNCHDIEIINLKKMEVSMTLSAHPNNVTSLFACNMRWGEEKNLKPLLVSAGVEGMVQFWSLSKGESLNPLQTACLETGPVLSVALSRNVRSVLLVTAKAWMLFSAREFVEVQNIPAPENTEWRGGAFLTNHSVVIWTKDGSGYVYALPNLAKAQAISYGTERQTLRNLSEDITYFSDKDWLDDQSKLDNLTNQGNFRMGLLSKLQIKAPMVKPLYILQSPGTSAAHTLVEGTVWGKLFITGSSEGKVTLWMIPKKPNWTASPCYVKPAAESSLIPPESQIVPNVATPEVTATLVLPELLLLALGYSDGMVTLDTLPSREIEKRRTKKAHRAKVTCLMTWSKDNRLFLISGGSDFRVKVWTIKDNTLKLAWDFGNHTGSITHLFRPPITGLPPSIASLWEGTFFSISKDKTVGLFSAENLICKHIFGVHPTAISNIRWKPDQDYLLVKCEDGSVSIWEMGTGELEACVYGEPAEDIFQNSTPLLLESDFNSLLEGKSIASFSTSMLQDPPLQMLLLDIRTFLKQLQLSDKPGSWSEGNQSPLFKCLSYLLPWGLDADLDQVFREKLHLQAPLPSVSLAIRGAGGYMSVMVGTDRWTRNTPATTQHGLAVLAVCKHLLQNSYFQSECSPVIQRVFDEIPAILNKYSEPHLPFLARFWRDSQEDLMQAARSLFTSIASMMSPEKRQQVAKEFGSQFQEDSPDANALAILGLGVLGSQFPDSLDKDLAGQVVNELLKLLQSKDESNNFRVTAAELLGKGFLVWREHFKNVDALIQQLFNLSLPNNPTDTSNTAHHALMLIGAAEPKQFLVSLGQYIVDVHYLDSLLPSSAHQHSAAIATLGALIKQDPFSLLPLLPRLVETVVQSLDPHVPSLRDSCLAATTKVLHALVKSYPMVSFHQDSQRLAVGTKDGVVVIYDLKTATRWHVLEEGHKKPVSAISFSPNGRTLVTYCILTSQIRIYSTNTTWYTIWQTTPHCTRTVEVTKVDKNLTNINLLEAVRIKWASPNTIELQRTWEGSFTFKL